MGKSKWASLLGSGGIVTILSAGFRRSLGGAAAYTGGSLSPQHPSPWPFAFPLVPRNRPPRNQLLSDCEELAAFPRPSVKALVNSLFLP